MVVLAMGSLAVFLGLALWGWGDVRGFLAHPARAGACLATIVMTVAAIFSGGNVSPGRRADTHDQRLFLPAAVVTLVLAWLPAYTDRRDLWTLDGDTVRYLGLALFVAGGVLRLAPMFVLGHRFSAFVAIQEGHELVTTGLYRAIRHPSYLGGMLGLAGWMLVFRSALGLLATLLLAPVLVARINAEEAMLASEFGAPYAAYQRRSWRLLPFIY